MKSDLMNTQAKVLQKGTKMHKGTSRTNKRIFTINA